MIEHPDAVHGAALDWLVRVNDPAFAAWDDFEAWLQADAAHADVYWRLAEDEAEATSVLAQGGTGLPAAVRRRPVKPRSRSERARNRPVWLAAGIGIAAAVVGVVWLGWSERSQPWSVQTAPGEDRTLTLADGSTLHLDGATQISMDRNDPREVRLVSGRAIFDVVHDDRRPFEVRVTDASVVDVGTVFEVTRLSDGVRVGVSEGRVRFERAGRTESLGAGEQLTEVRGRLSRRAVTGEAVTGWRDGRLTYNAESLGVVAEDIQRQIGRQVTVDPRIAGRTFSGSLTTAGSSEALRRRVELLLEVSVVDDGQTWRLGPPGAR